MDKRIFLCSSFFFIWCYFSKQSTLCKIWFENNSQSFNIEHGPWRMFWATSVAPWSRHLGQEGEGQPFPHLCLPQPAVLLGQTLDTLTGGWGCIIWGVHWNFSLYIFDPRRWVALGLHFQAGLPSDHTVSYKGFTSPSGAQHPHWTPSPLLPTSHPHSHLFPPAVLVDEMLRIGIHVCCFYVFKLIFWKKTYSRKV